jgi:hypothetical protein
VRTAPAGRRVDVASSEDGWARSTYRPTPRDLKESRRRRRARRKATKRHHPILIASALGVVVLIGVAGYILASAYREAIGIYQSVKGIQPQLETARASLASGQIPAGNPFGQAVNTAQTGLDNLENAGLPFRIVERIPLLNRPLDAIKLGVAAADEDSKAAVLMRDMVVDTLGDEALAGQSSTQPAPIFRNGTVNVALIQSLGPRLDAVIRHLQAGDAFIRAIPHVPFVPKVETIKATALAQSAGVVKLAQGAQRGLALLPSFLGANGPRTYLLAMQNNSDQRPTGGAMLAYALATFNHGKISLSSAGSVNAIDSYLGFTGVPLPAPIRWYLDNIPKQHPRIANMNWTPDFPTDGVGWRSLVKAATGVQVDGVIAVDPFAIAGLMGSQRIHVPSFPQAITRTNIVKAIENQQYTLSRDQQFQFPGQLINAAWPIFSNPHPFLPYIKAFQAALAGKNVQIWSANRQEEALLEQLKWDGGIHVNPGDYLYLTDGKLTGNKIDYYMHYKIDYTVDVASNGTATSRCQITITNTTPPNLPRTIVGTGGYGVDNAVVSLYTPAGASPFGAALQHLPHLESGAKVFVRQISLLPLSAGGHPLIMAYTYHLPGAIVTEGADRFYQLTLQHQPMVNPVQVTVTVHLPEGQFFKSFSPGWTINQHTAMFKGTLTRDVVTRVGF